MKGHYSESLHKIDQKSFIHILLPIDRKFRLKKNSNQLIFKIYSFEKIKENEIRYKGNFLEKMDFISTIYQIIGMRLSLNIKNL